MRVSTCRKQVAMTKTDEKIDMFYFFLDEIAHGRRGIPTG